MWKFLRGLLWQAVVASSLVAVSATSSFVTTKVVITRENSTRYALRNTPLISAKINSASVLVSIEDRGQHIGSGSGVIISHKFDHTWILTAAHVAKMGMDLTVINVDLGIDCPAKLVRGGDESIGDFATLVVPGLFGTPVGVCSDEDLPVLGEYVIAGGFALGLPHLTITDGYSSGLRSGLVPYSACSIFGNSGGGVFVLRKGEPVLLGLSVLLRGAHGVAVPHMALAYPVMLIRFNGGLKDVE